MTGDVRWFKRDLSVNKMGPLNCLSNNEGVVGCASYAATSHIYKVKANGEIEYNYYFTGDNPETCVGIKKSGGSQDFYVLLESASTSYTATGF
jgi:hypothetical protein